MGSWWKITRPQKIAFSLSIRETGQREYLCILEVPVMTDSSQLRSLYTLQSQLYFRGVMFSLVRNDLVIKGTALPQQVFVEGVDGRHTWNVTWPRGIKCFMSRASCLGPLRSWKDLLIVSKCVSKRGRLTGFFLDLQYVESCNNESVCFRSVHCLRMEVR